MKLTIENLFFNIPIYTKIIIDESSKEILYQLIDYSLVVEGFNPKRKVQSTFQLSQGINYSNRNLIDEGGYATLAIRCKRYDDVFFFYILWNPKTQILLKIGQHPSVADFHIGEINQYKTVLSTEKLKEFTKAIGLAANGVGIGSFVYLRRIFEHLIYEAFDQAKKEGNINESDFHKGKMDQKINLLQNYLPPFLVESRAMYSILSKGIHELDDDTCLNHFDSLRVGIEIILDEKLEEARKKEKVDAARKKIQAIQGKIKQ